MPEVVYYETARGDEPVAAYVERLGRSGDKRDVAAILDLIVELEERGSALRMPDARIIDGNARIFELRPRSHRIAYAEYGGRYVLLHAWRKQSQHLDRRALATAQRRLTDWRNRHGQERQTTH
ncbi:MAG: type II toxin-antitoxin system RelE/ParE family toxin [Chloroflexi bacterium]|nr:type II toxin-antitoxin system RelE/ParE family toxin [Chloroflexota bacterium]